MIILCCPRCRRRSLISTGIFWGCDSCSYAITQAALVVEEKRSREAGHISHARATGTR